MASMDFISRLRGVGWRCWAAARLAVMALGVLSAPAHAELWDVALASQGDRAQVRLAFTGPVSHAQAAPSGAGVLLRVTGVDMPAERWEFAPGGLVVSLQVRPQEDGAHILLRTRVPVIAARAHADDAAAVIDVVLAQPASQPRGPAPLYAPGALPPASTSDSVAAAGAARRSLRAPMDAAAGASIAPDAGRGSLRGSASRRGEDGAGRSQHQGPQAASSAQTGAAGAQRGGPAPSTATDPRASVDLGASRDVVTLLAGDLDQGQCDAARAAVEADPWDMARLQSHGACLARAGRGDDAADVFARILSFAPDNVEAQLGLGVARHMQGRTAEAERLFADALAASLTDAAAARARGFLDAAQATR